MRGNKTWKACKVCPKVRGNNGVGDTGIPKIIEEQLSQSKDFFADPKLPKVNFTAA